jgi:hypothetical protein
MEIKIEGNPGTGNTFQEINIQHVENYNPNATTVTNNYFGTRAKSVPSETNSPDPVETAPIRDEILLYVSRLRTRLADEWKSRYQQVWADIIDLPVVAASVYNPGKQQGTNFNRNLVANIIHFLGSKGAFNEYNAAQFALLLEDSSDHSVRSALGSDPVDEIIKSRLVRYFQD